MNVAQVCLAYCPHIGGVETNVKEISERLVKKGFNVEVLTTDPSKGLPKEEIIDGVYVRRFKSWAPNEAYFFSRDLKRFLAKNSDVYDIMHAHSYHALPALYAAQAKKKSKLVFTPHYHGKGHTFFRNLLHIPYKFVARKIFKKADKIICVSNYEKSLVMDNFKVEKEKISVIPNGLNPEEFRGLRKGEKDYAIILYVGRLEKYKGVHFLIRALPKLNSDIILEIVGKGSYKNSLVKLARKLGIGDRVRFYQDLSRKQLLQRYADADLFTLLSQHEAYGISVAEALASGTPCIVTNTSALREWIDNKNCFGIDCPADVDKLVELINGVIGTWVGGLELLSWSEVANRLAKLYEQCLEQ